MFNCRFFYVETRTYNIRVKNPKLQMCFVLACCFSALMVSQPSRQVEWLYYGGDQAGTKYSSLTDINASSVRAKSVSGGFEYFGTILKGGDYDVNVHSGTIRFALSNPAGFSLNADSFSGSIRTDFPVTIGGSTSRGDDRQRVRMGIGRSVHGVNGDGSATLTLRTFSGDIVIIKR